jgi:hypothetical protein
MTIGTNAEPAAKFSKNVQASAEKVKIRKM